MQSPPHFIFAVRYSVLQRDSRNWRIARRSEGIEAYKESLYDPRRISAHRRLFENLTVPSIVAQANAGFHDRLALHVVSSTHLPASEKDHLNRILSPYSWAKVVYISEDEQLPFKSLRDDYLSSKVQGEACYAHCRLDDDDAISVDFLARLQEYVRDDYMKHAVSFGMGVNAYYNTITNEIERICQYYEPKTSAGLAHIGKYSTSGQNCSNAMAFGLGNHTKADQKFPVILDSRVPSFIRTTYSGQDTSNSFAIYCKKRDEKSNYDYEYSNIKKYFSIGNGIKFKLHGRGS